MNFVMLLIKHVDTVSRNMVEGKVLQCLNALHMLNGSPVQNSTVLLLFQCQSNPILSKPSQFLQY